MPPSSSFFGTAPLFLTAWLLTLLVHSTVLLGGVWLVVRSGLIRSHAWKETLWKAALVGGLVTATAQIGLSYEPMFGRLALSSDSGEAVLPAPNGASGTFFVTLGDGADATPVIQVRPHVEESRAAVITKPVFWAPILLGVWFLAAAWGLARFARLKASLRRVLRGRVPVEDERVIGVLESLRAGAGFAPRITLSTLSKLGGPIAFGRREICIPARALTHLSAEQQRSALAHEMAHLVRRDPAWLTWGGVLECLFFFQPLIRVARRELREIAEYQCDDWAVQQTGGNESLARCLAEVAAWNVGENPALASGMAESGSPLVRRITRLLVDRPAPRSVSLGRGHFAAAAGLLLLAAWAAPGIATHAVPAEDDFQWRPSIGMERDLRDAPRGRFEPLRDLAEVYADAHAGVGTGVHVGAGSEGHSHAGGAEDAASEIIWLVSPEEAGEIVEFSKRAPSATELRSKAEAVLRDHRSHRANRIRRALGRTLVIDTDGVEPLTVEMLLVEPPSRPLRVEFATEYRIEIRDEKRRLEEARRVLLEDAAKRIAMLDELDEVMQRMQIDLNQRQVRTLRRIVRDLSRDMERLGLDSDI